MSFDELNPEECAVHHFTITLVKDYHIAHVLFNNALTHFAERGVMDMITLVSRYDLIAPDRIACPNP